MGTTELMVVGIGLVAIVVIFALLALLTRPKRSGPEPVSWAASSSPAPASAVGYVPPSLRLDPATAQKVSALVEAQQTIMAIKVLRNATGLGLKEAKDWVENWTARATPLPIDRGQDVSSSVLGASSSSAHLDDDLRAVIAAKGEIAAIKELRSRTGWGLGEAKNYVDRLSRG